MVTRPDEQELSDGRTRLDALVGSWDARGETVDRIIVRGTDVYEWAAGGFFVLHTVDVHETTRRTAADVASEPVAPR